MPTVPVHPLVGGAGRSWRLGAWMVTLVVTVVSVCALDLFATAAGAGLAASGLLGGLSTTSLLVFVVFSYAAWGFGLRANVRANWELLTTTGTSTCAPSKAAHDLVRPRSQSTRAPRLAAATAYVGTNLAFDIPYWTGAFGAAAASETITSTGALVFIGGANLAASVYEYGVAGLTAVFLRTRTDPDPGVDPPDLVDRHDR